jgi:hypothetical protein
MINNAYIYVHSLKLVGSAPVTDSSTASTSGATNDTFAGAEAGSSKGKGK